MSAPASAAAEKARAFVLASATLRPVPLAPEIRLHLADDAFSVWEASEGWCGGGRGERPPPFWAFAWPGGQALARYILDRPDLVAGRTVLDVGAGSGIAGIAAAMAGAANVLASDLDPFAAAAIALNAAANGVMVEVTGDVLDEAGDDAGAGAEDADVILAADVWYERTLADRALRLMRRASERDARVLVGDLGRAFLPRQALSELASYDVPVLAELEDAPVKRVLILTLHKQTPRLDRPAP